jgi:hypothetical protein
MMQKTKLTIATTLLVTTLPLLHPCGIRYDFTIHPREPSCIVPFGHW